MKSVFFVLVVALSTPLAALAQFANFPAAERSLGAASPSEVGQTFTTAWTIPLPLGIALDPTSGKLFVSSLQTHRVLRFPSAPSLPNEAIAEGVLGQSSFAADTLSTSQSRLNQPGGIHVDRRGRLWIADTGNNRVLMFHSASNRGNGDNADLVLGQSTFTGMGASFAATGMDSPRDVFVDAGDNLWVADTNNHRVLKFSGASLLTNGAPAAVVLGQIAFAAGFPSNDASRMNLPMGVFVDDGGRLWVADFGNHRVLRFDGAAGLANGASADRFLGQGGFGSSLPGAGALSMNGPRAVALDARGTLWVVDSQNHRILGYDHAATKISGSPADRVIGQPGFATVGLGSGPQELHFPIGLAFDQHGGLWVADTANHRALRYPPDLAGPVLQLRSRVPRRTRSARLRLSGTATDSGGVAAVRFRVGRGRFANARGTTSWTAVARLSPGRNRITIIAEDGFGNPSPALQRRVRRR